MDILATQLLQLRGTNPATVHLVCIDELTQADLDAALRAVADMPHISKLIVIYKTSNVASKKILFFKTLFDLDVFESAALSILLTGHRLLPAFKRLEPAARAAFLEKYPAINLPSMCASDPMTLLYDFKLGDVVQITRKSGKIYYRQIIED